MLGVPYAYRRSLDEKGPRFRGDTPEKGPVWWVPKQEMYAEGYRLKGRELFKAVERLRSSLDKVLFKHYWLSLDVEDYEKEDERYFERLKRMIGKVVEVKVDRPLGSADPSHPDFSYPINCGHIEPMRAPDGGYQDAYVLGINKAVPFFAGVVIGAIRRIDTTEGKLIVAPKGIDYSDEEILKEVGFRENISNLCCYDNTGEKLLATRILLPRGKTKQKQRFLFARI